MTESFWQTALSATPAEPEQSQLSAADVDLADWAQHRGELGVHDSGDFIGTRTWRRPVRPVIEREPSELERYAAERAAHRVHEAPQSSAGDPRANAASQRTALASTYGPIRTPSIKENSS